MAKVNEIEKVIRDIVNDPHMDFPTMRRKLRALVRESYLIGKHHGVMSCPRKDAEHYFKHKFGFKP